MVVLLFYLLDHADLGYSKIAKASSKHKLMEDPACKEQKQSIDTDSSWQIV
jgi:hypothetical protein